MDNITIARLGRQFADLLPKEQISEQLNMALSEFRNVR